MKTALITGISGQDGSYLAELLLTKGYEVHGTVLASELADPPRLWRIAPILNKINLHLASIEDLPAMLAIIGEVHPDECYHLAALSVVRYDLSGEFDILRTNVDGTHNILYALKQSSPSCRYYFAGSSEMFGIASIFPQDENTSFHPRSVYGITKLAGYHLTRLYRETHDLFTCAGILYNHESERRGEAFVTRKITRTAARIKMGIENELRLGNLDARRDWGYAPDYVKAMWLMLQHDRPEDFVVASGQTHSVREFAAAAFAALDLDWRPYVVVDPAFYRPAEAVPLVGNPTRAKDQLGWQPTVTFEDLVERMVRADIERIKAENR